MMYELSLNYNKVAEAERKSDFVALISEWLLLNPNKPSFGDITIVISEVKEEPKKEEKKV